jgi:adenylyl cyclase-associated protein
MASMTEHQSLTTLIKRLEAATSRLEDLATSSASSAAVANRSSVGGQPAASSLVSSQSSDAAVGGEALPALAAYDELIEGPLKNYLELSKAIGDLVENQVKFFLH